MKDSEELPLKPAVIERWLERLRHFFPNLDRFDQPDQEFDKAERNYKLETSSKLQAAIANANSDAELADAVHNALKESNLLQWRTYWPMSTKGNANRELLWPALRKLVNAALEAPAGHATAVDDFVNAWLSSVPDGKADPARQIAEFVLFHIAPRNSIFIRHFVRQDLWREAVGSKFPDHRSIADTYRDELRFMQAVRDAFVARGLAPRDMIDVQGALWVIYSYKNEDEGKDDSFPTLSRDKIEEAMDAYDLYRQAGEHAGIFDAFRKPQDYWVRSSRNRPNRIYPSKPIVGFALQNTGIYGGWSSKDHAASLLYNSGYIIVDPDDQPEFPPDTLRHFINDANRIRLAAFNYYIAPAQELGAPEVQIRASDLGRDIGLRDAFSNICSALGGKKFQIRFNLMPPTNTIPNPSSSTTFTYYLYSTEVRDPGKYKKAVDMIPASNVILYGPPGTGKTFATRKRAVELIDGTAPNGREAIKSRYEELEARGQIAFVTFHQSYSYEDFVEGLRPTTDPLDESALEGRQDSGFRLKAEPGVFRAVAALAEQARTAKEAKPSASLKTDMAAADQPLSLAGRRVFKMSLGKAWVEEDIFDKAIAGGYAAIGWSGEIDWSDPKYRNFHEVAGRWREQPGEEHTSGRKSHIKQLWRFREMDIGDLIIVSQGNHRFRALGIVTGDYQFNPADENEFFHRRAVDWRLVLSNPLPVEEIYEKSFSQASCYKLDDGGLKIPAIERLLNAGGQENSNASRADTEGNLDAADAPRGGVDQFVLIIDEINRANISKVFGELITLIEPDKRLGMLEAITVRLPYSRDKFGIPCNLHILGTMNTADRSIALLDTALRRRFMFEEMMPEPHRLKVVEGIDLAALLRSINKRIEYLLDRERQIGHAFFMGCQSKQDIDIVMATKIIPLLCEYFFEDLSSVAAVLGQPDGGGAGFMCSETLTSPFPSTFSEPRLSWRIRPQVEFTMAAYDRAIGKTPSNTVPADERDAPA